MKSFLRIALIVLGSVLVFAAVLFWTVGVNILLKVPGDIDSESRYEGEMTWYVDPATFKQIPEGSLISQPMKATRQVVSLDDEYSSSTAVIKSDTIIEVAGVKQDPSSSVYTIDRNDKKNVVDDRAYAFDKSIKVDRSGAYYPVLPYGISKEGNYPLWKNEVNRAFDMVYVGEENKEGLEVCNFKVEFEKEPVWESYVKVLNLPTEISFGEFKSQLSSSGIDVDGLLSLASQVLTAEDLEAVVRVTDEAIPINYCWDYHVEASVEPTTGSIVNLYINKDTLSMELDYTGLQSLFSILMKYGEDPVLGPAVKGVSSLQGQLGEAVPQKIMGYEYSQTADSVSEAVEKVKDSRSLMGKVKLWLPLIVIIAGILLLIGGVVWQMRSRKV